MGEISGSAGVGWPVAKRMWLNGEGCVHGRKSHAERLPGGQRVHKEVTWPVRRECAKVRLAVVERGSAGRKEANEVDTNVAGRRTYPVGSDRDVRVRAVLGTHRVELGVRAIEEGLRAIRFVGRVLRLRYHRRDQRFSWRHRLRDGEGRAIGWEDIGARVPEEIRRGLWEETRSRIDGAEEWMAMRQDGRSVLILADWLAAHALETPPTVVTMTWRGEGRLGRIRWTFRADGRMQRTADLGAPKRLVSAYGKATAAVLAAIDIRQGQGPYAATLDRMLVARYRAVDGRLADLASILREQQSDIRLYRLEEKDTWRFHEVDHGEGWTRYVQRKSVASRSTRLAAQPQSQVVEAVKLLEERGQIRRLLRVIAELTEAAAVWPGGQWSVVGRGTEGQSLWRRTATREGIVGGRYGTEMENRSVSEGDEEGGTDGGEIW